MSNIIVLYMELSFFGGQRELPIIRTTGDGPVDIFTGGTHRRGTWYRENMEDWMRFVSDMGGDMPLKPGKTFIQIVPMDMEITTIAPNGETAQLTGFTTLDMGK